MSDKDNGGPAFPDPEAAISLYGEGHADACMGMTLRDYFAAKAMQGLMDRRDYDDTLGNAEVAYLQADAMLAARAN